MQVLMLTRYDALGASSRVRTFQYIPSLKAAGIKVSTSPLLGDGYVADLYSGNVSKAKVLISYLKRVKKLIDSNSYEIIWIEKEALPWLPAFVEKLLLPAKTKIVVDYDDAIFHRYDQNQRKYIRWMMGKKIDHVMRNADMVTAGNSYLAARAEAAGSKKIVWLPTVVDLDRYPLKTKSSESKEITVGWIGSPTTTEYLYPLKNAMGILSKRHPIKWVAVGSRKDQLNETLFEAKEWREEDEVQRLHEFDIGIMPLPDLPFEHGKCGYKLIQYMACGLPVVASPIGVNCDIVENKKNGILASSTNEWVDAIEYLILNPEARKNFGLAGRKKVEKSYSLQAQAPRLIEILKSVCE